MCCTEDLKPLFIVGLVVLVLGIASLFIALPKKERHAIEVGDVSIGVQTTEKKTVSPIVSGVLVVAGAGLMIAGRSKTGS